MWRLFAIANVARGVRGGLRDCALREGASKLAGARAGGPGPKQRGQLLVHLGLRACQGFGIVHQPQHVFQGAQPSWEKVGQAARNALLVRRKLRCEDALKLSRL